MVVQCAGCERPIVDRFLLNVLDRAWHVGCVQCTDCKSCLSERCFSRDGKLFCRQDFFRRYGAKCGGCELEILPNELVRRARSRVYHLKCFTCMVCRKQLSTGEELYMVDDNRFLCKDDYIAKFQGSDIDDADADLEPTLLEAGCDDTFSDKDGGGCLSGDDDDDDDVTSRDSATGGSASRRPPLVGPAGTGNGFPHHHHHHHHHRHHHGHHGQHQFGANGIKSEGGLRPGGLSPGCATGGGGQTSPLGGSGGGCCGVKSERLSNDVMSNDSNCSNEKMELSLKDKENNNTPGKDSASGGGVESSSVAGKRRGPRTTIKAKQLETLKAAFAATPKPTRHIREQLAQETGLNMRVIQVWFQNRRSKERRMKQLSALGVRRQFYRNPRRLRALRPGEDMVDGAELLGQAGFNYFVDGGDFYAGYPPYGDYFAAHHPDPSMTYLGPPSSGQQAAMMEHVNNQAYHESAYLTPNDLALRQSSTPDNSPMAAMLRDAAAAAAANGAHFGPPVGGPHHGMPGAGLHGPFGRHPGLRHPPPPVSVPMSVPSSQPLSAVVVQQQQQPMEMPAEIW